MTLQRYYQTFSRESPCLVAWGWLWFLYEGDEFGETAAVVGSDITQRYYQTFSRESPCLVPWGWLRSSYEGDEFGETAAVVGADGARIG